MKKYIYLFLLLTTVISCSNEEEPNQNPVIDIEDAKNASIDFALKILYNLAADSELRDENLIISPLSIQAALYMTLNGAEGNTESQMKETLELGDIQPNNHNTAFKDLLSLILENNESSKLDLSNAIFYDDSKISVNPAFEQRIENFYDAQFYKEDFTNENTIDVINDWVKESTENRIEKIIENIDPAEIMFLINALIFQGDWQKGFPEYGTIKRNFRLSSGELIETDVMSSDDFRPNTSNFLYDAVDFTLSDSIFAMTFIRPNSTDPADFIHSYATIDEFNSFYENLTTSLNKESRVFVHLPKFESGSKLKLKKVLQSLGMEDAFNLGKANFSDFGSSAGNLYLSRVIHDTYLKIDEKGVEGAAVTAVGVSVTSVPPVINFDRPFLFFLRHLETNAIIFAGYINNPTK